MSTNDNTPAMVTNNEKITYENYLKRLFEICKDCNREVYLSEIFMPLLSMCCPENMKVVPVFDDRNSGKKTENETNFTKRMKLICATTPTDAYVVPDFIFVPLDYSFDNPCKPYLMVETKLPLFPQYKRASKGLYYCPLEKTINTFKDIELIHEINACGCVIYTDGITWMILENNQGKLSNKKNYDPVKFVNEYEYHSKRDVGLRITIKDSAEQDEWNKLKNQILKLLKEISNEQTISNPNI